MRLVLATLALLCALALPAGAEGLSGQVRVIDGDSLKMGTTEIRLEGIDAPEWDQVCHRGEPRRRYRCGLQAKDALRALIGDRTVTCEPVAQPNGTTTDAYGRTLALCRVAGAGINAWMVEQGHALAFRRYSDRFLPEEDRARAAGAGMWAGPHMAPWEWRLAKKLAP